MIAVPLRYGTRVIGAVVISKLGVAQFDEDDVRLLEVLGGHASVAVENARLYEAERLEAEARQGLARDRQLAARLQPAARGRRDARRGARARGRAVCAPAPPAALVALAPGRRRRGPPAACARRLLPGGRRSAAGRSPFPHERARELLGRNEPFQTTSTVDSRREPRSGGGPHRHRSGPHRPGQARLHRRSGRARRRRLRRAQHAAAGRRRAPGQAGDRQRLELREPRADVPLDRRGARERAGGERRVHVLARPLDHRPLPARRTARSASTPRRSSVSSSAPSSTTSARSGSPRRSSPSRARSTTRSGRSCGSIPSWARASSRRSNGSRRSARSSSTATSTGTAAAIPTASPARRSRWSPA